jgi:hypothetical protein
MGPFWLPTINTALLLTSGITLTIAHHALRAGQRGKTIAFMWLTVLLGVTFLFVQGYEYHHAYSELNLKLSLGVYGSTFFMLTGFHGFHVFVGMLMLLFITLRLMRGHFTADRHFGSRAPPGTGTSSTWSGSACTWSSTGCDARRPDRPGDAPASGPLHGTKERLGRSFRWGARAWRWEGLAADRQPGRLDPAELPAHQDEEEQRHRQRDAQRERIDHAVVLRSPRGSSFSMARPARARAPMMRQQRDPDDPLHACTVWQRGAGAG